MFKRLKYFLFSLIFLALSFPAKAFGMQDLYGTMQVKYGVPGSNWGQDPQEVWYLWISRFLFFIMIPLIIVVLVVIFLKRRKK